jgi:hypothetical protein
VHRSLRLRLLGHLSIKESRCARRVGAFDQSGKLGTTEVTIEIENPMPGLSQLDGYVNELLAVPMLKDLPQHILDDINWLNDDDVIAAREMLANLDRRLNETRVMYARQELARIHGLLSENKDMNGHYRMEFINGTINVRFERKPEPFSLFRWLCS